MKFGVKTPNYLLFFISRIIPSFISLPENADKWARYGVMPLAFLAIINV
jgi:hypothetical protein